MTSADGGSAHGQKSHYAVSSMSSGADRRRFPRLPLNLLVQYRFDSYDEFLAEYAINISTGGIFIRTDTPYEEGAMIFMQFSLKDGRKLIEGMGKVVRVNPIEVDGRAAGMGVEFVNFDPESIELIDNIMKQRGQA